MRLIRPLAAAAALAALLSCAPTPPKPAETAPGLEERAGRALEAQDYARAAELYDSAAERHEAPAARARAAIRAAEAWLEAGQAGAAAQALGEAEGLRGELGEPGRTRLGLARARLALAQGRPAAASRYLERLPAPPASHRAAYYTLRARVAEQQGERLEAVRLRVDLEPHLESAAARAENRRALWRLLAETPGPLLRERASAAGEGTLGGWLRLALLAREHRLAPQRLEEAVTAWEARFPEHPARERRVPELLTQFRERIQRPGHIALLLPLSGDFAAAAEAVRHGILAAYYAAEGERPELRVYDTSGDGQRAVAAYQRAVEAGADYAIGPLTKAGVAALAAEYEQLPTPVLGLNDPGEGDGARQALPARLYRFSLSAEAEARQAARYALRQGWRSVLILTPESEWGERLGEAYAEAIEARGGRVLQRSAYAPDEPDHSGVLRELLRLDASRERYRRLARVLGETPRFEPRRRRDADALLLGALPRQARLLRPQIEYHRASGLPVVATSHAYGGTVQPDLDRDLEGLRFLDGPWLVDSAVGVPRGLERAYLSRQWPERMQGDARLIALGIDAYRIIPYLGVMAEHPEERIDGLTGRLRLSEAGRVERRLVAARFADGRPVAEIQATEGYDGQQQREGGPQAAAP
ncbi:penicillin-binding protein activator [Halorhodospira neutriphila]|uniref:penicillin-binding protein activator n=1 Tax=Halorhodospira neutriphila TaxID=168379 RepID=UPI001903E39F|nr:penicillin-binding protein activator [Halorhodospira neutriphila]